MVLQEACSCYGIPYSPQDLKSKLWGKLKEYIRQNIEPIICTMAANRGYEVIFSPPHHSDLQPIEIVWAITKGEAGRQYSTETMFSQVLSRTKVAVNALASSTIAGCIRNVNKHLMELHDDIMRLEDVDESKDDDAEDSDSSSEDESD